MGWNTAIMILNDRLHDIEDDPTFGRELDRAVQRHHMNSMYESEEFSHQSQVLAQQHADTTSVVAVGGNTGFMVDVTWGGFYNPDMHDRLDPHPRGFTLPLEQQDGWDRLKLLRQLADSMGYTLRKKPERKRA